MGYDPKRLMFFDSHKKFSICLFLVVIIMVVFWPPKGIDFINYDDIEYVTENSFVKSGLKKENIGWAFTATVQEHWHPLTWLSHMLDCQLFGLNPKNHHLTNIFFHAMNALLFFIIFIKMTGALWRSALVAALFAVHPLHVESVMWVAERKDLLSTFFWALTLWAYLGYVEKPNQKRYLLSLMFFALGLLSKPMIVTLPCLLILLDFWPLERYGEDFQEGFIKKKILNHLKTGKNASIALYLLIEKIPFFILSLAISIVLLITHQDRILQKSYQLLPLTARIENAFIYYLEYIGKMIWPQNLAISYPPIANVSFGKIVCAGIFLLSVTLMTITQVKRHPYLIIGWLWFIGTLAPVIGIVATGPHYVADRYTYIPIVGLFIMIVWGIHDCLKNWRYQKIVLTTIAPPIIVVLCVLSWLQAQRWKNSIALFSHAIEVTTNNEKAHMNLGTALALKGQHSQAVYHFSKALEIKPHSEELHTNMALSLMYQGKYKQAADHFSKAIQINPNNANLYVNLGITFAQRKQLDKARLQFAKAVEINPDNPKAHYNLGMTYALQSKRHQAIRHFKTALELNPDYQLARRRLEDLNQGFNDANMLLK